MGAAMNHSSHFNTNFTTFPGSSEETATSILTPSSWVEISCYAIRDNITQFKQFIGQDKVLGIVIKSNAYGHGLLQVAQVCQEHAGVDYLLVAHVSEAVTLRQAGIIKKILLVSPARDNLIAAAYYDCEIMVTDKDILEQLQAICTTLQKKINIHIKVDTGLSRFGFAREEVVHLLQFIKALPMLTVMGIYTHFAESNSSDLTFTHAQEQTFNTLLTDIEQAGFIIPLRHYSNTAATTALSHERVNFFRLGAGTYGIWPSEANQALINENNYPIALTPALQWKTKIIHIKTVRSGNFIGYNRTMQTDKDMKIAIIPVGYYDGYDKRLSNKGVAYINGYYASIIGTIAMNATTLDITEIPNAKLDDIVTLVGPYPHISPADLANQTECFNARQITAQINPSIPRTIHY